MTANRIVWSGLAGLALVAPAIARADDSPVALAYAFKAKDNYRTKQTVNASFNGSDVVVNATTKFEIKEIKPNGDVVIITTNEGGHVSGAIDQDQPARPPQESTRSKVGKLVEYKPDEEAAQFMAPEVQKLTAMIGEPIMPEKPVKPGDTWTTELDNPVVKDKKVTVKTTFVGIDKVDGVDLWKIKQTSEAATDANGGKTSMETTSWINPTNGWNVKTEATVKDLPTMLGAISMTMKSELIKPEAGKK